MKFPINDNIKLLLKQQLNDLEDYLKADILTFYGPIDRWD